MKKIFSVFLILLIIFAFSGKLFTGNRFVSSHAIAQEDKEKFVKDELIIGYKDDVNLEEASKKMKQKHGVTQLEVGYKGNFEVVKIPNDKKLADLISDISNEKEVKYAEYNFMAYTDAVPNDPKFDPYQWNFYEYGKESVTKPGYPSNYGIQAVKAWELSTGTGVTIAILDTGIAYESYKIYQKIKGKQVLIKEYKLAPDLATTKFDKTNARNFTVTTPTNHANDDHGHGTHVCGTIAAMTNDSIGCAGIAYDSTILPVKVLNSSGGGTYAQISNGIYWAADHGAKVINMSLGGTGYSDIQFAAVDYAYHKGVTIICAAGNRGAGDNAISYPAAYEHCIAVSATRFDGTKTNYSSYGSYVDIAAPGGDKSIDQNGDGSPDGILQQTFYPYVLSNGTLVYSFNQTFDYYPYNGTSMASPHVAGVAALVISYNKITRGVTLTPEQVETALTSKAKDLGEIGRDDFYGYGLVDAYGSVADYTP